VIPKCVYRARCRAMQCIGGYHRRTALMPVATWSNQTMLVPNWAAKRIHGLLEQDEPLAHCTCTLSCHRDHFCYHYHHFLHWRVAQSLDVLVEWREAA